jgi:hypothetical protein
MAETVRLKVLKQTYIFQKDLLLDVSAHIQPGNGSDIPEGYLVPDIGNGLPGILPVKAVKKVKKPIEESDSYFGKCLLTKVSNFYKDPTKNESEGIETNGIVNPEKVRVIHYPDCQQMVFHMPKFAYYADSYQLIDNVTGAVMEDLEVKDRLSGSTMMQIDTLPYRPGFYTIEASWPDGWTHQVRFIKFMEGFPNANSDEIPENVRLAIKGLETHLQPPYVPEVYESPTVSRIKKPAPYKDYKHPPGNVTIVQNDHEYRLFDSNGVEIDNGVDLNKFKKKLLSKFGPVVEYSQDGRGGTITYIEGEINIVFDWEFAGGNGVVLFLIPEVKYWEAATKTPLSRRDEILEFVSNRVILDKALGCHFQIYSNSVSILRR